MAGSRSRLLFMKQDDCPGNRRHAEIETLRESESKKDDETVGLFSRISKAPASWLQIGADPYLWPFVLQCQPGAEQIRGLTGLVAEPAVADDRLQAHIAICSLTVGRNAGNLFCTSSSRPAEGQAL